MCVSDRGLAAGRAVIGSCAAARGQNALLRLRPLEQVYLSNYVPFHEGSENVLIYLLQRHDYTLWNPCQALRLLHASCDDPVRVCVVCA